MTDRYWLRCARMAAAWAATTADPALKRLRDRIAAVRAERQFFEAEDYMRIIRIGRWGALQDIGDAHKAGLLAVRHYGPGNRVRAVYEIIK